MNRLEKDKWVSKQIIDEMFMIAGHPDITYEDVIDRKDAWYSEWCMTMEQNEQWKKAGIKILQQELIKPVSSPIKS